jgi:RND family efflux transporter MFP subunit
MPRPSCLFRYLLLLLVPGAISCGNSDAVGQGAPAAPPPLDVQTVTLALKPIPQRSEFVATIRSLRSITVQPQVDGFVRQILVKAGDRVRAGQPLVQIDPDLQQAAATVTASQRGGREADLALAQQQLARTRTLHEAGAVSRAELDAAEATYKNAEAQLAAVQSQILEDQVQLHYYRVAAPFGGTVGDIPVRQGDRVTQSTVITTIDQAEGLEVYINVPLEQAVGLSLGLPVELIAGDGQTMSKTAVSFIAPRTDDATQSVLVKAPLRDARPSLRVMQYVRARIIWSSHPGLSVPLIAVSRLAGQSFVFVAEQGDQGVVARQKPVTLGQVIGNDYEVRSGLKTGDRVIVSNIQKIGDGSPVKPG